MNRFTERGGRWVVCQGVLLLAVCGLGWAGQGAWSRTWGWLGGAVCGGLGAAIGLAGARALGRNLTPFPKPRQGATLITGGIYGWIRHPLYTSVTLAAIGWALAWRSWPSLVAASLLVPFFTAKAAREERWLRGQFPGYADYVRRTRRFLPWIY
jgi:protein-S-isoprenylcysteine O-methyltransferase Ste14